MENRMINKTFWEGKNVFITGHTGFKGSWLSLWLQALGAQVSGYSLPPNTKPNLFELANVGANMHNFDGDIRNLGALKNAFERTSPEIVIHMAAQPLVHSAYAHPAYTYETNLMGTVNVLESVRNTDSVRVAVCITSDKCYENNEWVWGYRETDRLGGHDPYSSSKACAELAIDAYRTSYFTAETHGRPPSAIASTRAGNVIGGGDWSKDRLIPDIMSALLEDKPITIRNPNAIRPWQHVLEPLSGYLVLAERLFDQGVELAQSWNFGPDGETKPVSWIAQYITHLWGVDAPWQQNSTDFMREDTYLQLDCSKARSQLGWSPRIDLPTALEWIVEWYQKYRQNSDIRDITETQIFRFENWNDGDHLD